MPKCRVCGHICRTKCNIEACDKDSLYGCSYCYIHYQDTAEYLLWYLERNESYIPWKEGC